MTIELDERSDRMFEIAAATCGGPPAWRQRKTVEARGLLALTRQAGPSRMETLLLDLSGDLRAIFKLHVPVALEPGPDGRMRTAPEAVLGMVYPEVALSGPVPGFSVMTLLYPVGAWYSTVGTARGQHMCLGASIPTSMPMTELILLAYGTLSLQVVQLDPENPLGVMNPAAARWWQQPDNRKLIPLTRETFIHA